MPIRDFLSHDAIKLQLVSATKKEVMRELVSLLALDKKSSGMLYKMLKRCENLGSSGIGRGIAIPHFRSMEVSRLRVVFVRKPEGIDFKAIDKKLVYCFFMLVAPPLDATNQFLPMLGKVIQLTKEPDRGNVLPS